MISDFLFHQRWSETFFVSAYQQLVSAFRFSQRFSFSSAIFFSSALISGYGYHYQRWSALLIPITHITADQRWRKRKSLISSSDFISGDDRWSAVMIIGAYQRWKLAEGSHHHASWPLISGFLFRPGWSFSSALIVSADQCFSFLFVSALISSFLFRQRFSLLSALISGYMGITVSAHQRCYR